MGEMVFVSSWQIEKEKCQHRKEENPKGRKVESADDNSSAWRFQSRDRGQLFPSPLSPSNQQNLFRCLFRAASTLKLRLAAFGSDSQQLLYTINLCISCLQSLFCPQLFSWLLQAPLSPSKATRRGLQRREGKPWDKSIKARWPLGRMWRKGR